MARTKKKTYTAQLHIGSANYVVTFWTGRRVSKSGSLTEDMRIFRSERTANEFIDTLHRQGYVGNGHF